MDVANVQRAFRTVERRGPRLALWMLPFNDGGHRDVLSALSKGYEAAVRSSPRTRHGVFHWSPERCNRIPVSAVEDAYKSVDFVFQFGYQDERLSSEDPRYMPWPLGTAGWRGWRSPDTKTLTPLSQRKHLAVFRGSSSTHEKAWGDFNAYSRHHEMVIQFRGAWPPVDTEADTELYRELLASGQYALAPGGHNPICYRIQEAVESGSVPVIVLGSPKHDKCYDNWSGLFGLPLEGATEHPWIPAAPFHTLRSWSDLDDHMDAMRAGATDRTGEKLQRWYRRWLGAFRYQLELVVHSSIMWAPHGRRPPTVHVSSIGGLGATFFMHELNKMVPPIITNDPADRDELKNVPFGKIVQGARPEKIIYLWGDPAHAVEFLARRGQLFSHAKKIRSDPWPQSGAWLPETLTEYVDDAHDDFLQLEMHFDSFYNQCEIPIVFLRVDEETEYQSELADFLETTESEVARLLQAWTWKRHDALEAKLEDLAIREGSTSLRAVEDRQMRKKIEKKLRSVIDKYRQLPDFMTIIPGEDC